nr:MAG: hypothetical protein 1 [Leviviridae sp.]
MPTRARSRYGPDVTGRRRLKAVGDDPPGSWSYMSFKSSYEETEDVTGIGDNQPFVHEEIRKRGFQLTGTNGAYDWENYPATYQVSDIGAYNHLTLPPLDYAKLASSTLARTTPNRSSMESLVSLWEIRELPGMVKESYNIGLKDLLRKVPFKKFKFLTKAAKLNLLVQFGLMPMLGDLETLWGFTALHDRRVAELERLKVRGLRRTVDLEASSASQTWDNQFVHSNGATVKADIIKSTNRTVRGHARWRLRSYLNLKSDSELRATAKRLIVGAYLDPTTLYEAMPWSWLIDYFVNLGDFVAINRNEIDVDHDNPRIIVKTVTHTSSSEHSSGSLFLSPLDNWYDSGSRVPTVATLSARTDYLTGNQLSILGSLAVLSRR